MIEFAGVTVSHRTAAGEVRALDGIDLAIGKGEFVSVTGPSGSGKTTLLSVAAGLTTPAAGRVALDGADLSTLSASRRAALRLEKIGFVFQMFRLVPYLTALENVQMPMYLAGERPSHSASRAKSLLERMGLAGRATHRPSELSAGECQRVAICRAVALNPAVILADEPTGNLDEASGTEVLSTLREASAEGCTILLVTHDRRAAECAARHLELRDGRIPAP